MGCNDDVPKPAFLGDRPFACTAENFGRGECRAVDQNAQMQKDMSMMSGIIGTATVALGAGIAVIGALPNKKRSQDITNIDEALRDADRQTVLAG
jgi:hypothetical protein